jgi:hypothetical protein
MTLAQTIIAMIEAGCSQEQIGAIARIFEAKENEALALKRQNDADRKRKSRANLSVMSHDVTPCPSDICDKVSPPSPPLSSPPFLSPTPPNLTPPIIPPTTTPSKRPQAVDDVLTVRTILGACLSETSVDDLIEHRRKKKSPLTARAAKELVKQFTAFGDPEQAVALMILRGWTGFDPSWLDNQARAGPKIVARQKCFETSRPYMGR